FAVFRIGVQYAGREALGCWALIQGVMIIARIADSGMTTNITRLLAIRGSGKQAVSLRNIFAASVVVGILPVTLTGAILIVPVARYINYRYGQVVSLTDAWNMILASYLTGAIATA